MGGGSYPKHVWSPAGGWYSNPANWKSNTAVMVGVIIICCAGAFKISADNEYHTKMPEPGRFYPSRNWTKQIVEHEKNQRSNQTKES